MGYCVLQQLALHVKLHCRAAGEELLTPCVLLVLTAAAALVLLCLLNYGPTLAVCSAVAAGYLLLALPVSSPAVAAGAQLLWLAPSVAAEELHCSHLRARFQLPPCWRALKVEAALHC
jgi:hypothetical protein